MENRKIVMEKCCKKISKKIVSSSQLSIFLPLRTLFMSSLLVLPFRQRDLKLPYPF